MEDSYAFDVFFGTSEEADASFRVQQHAVGASANREALMALEMVIPGGDWLAGVDACPECVTTDIYFDDAAAATYDHVLHWEELVASDLDMFAGSLEVLLEEEAPEANRAALMQRPIVEVTQSVPYPCDSSPFNGDICFDFWPDFEAVHSEAQVAATMLGQALTFGMPRSPLTSELAVAEEAEISKGAHTGMIRVPSLGSLKVSSS